LPAARQGFVAYWDDGTHPTCGKKAPDDVKAWLTRFRRFRLDESFPAFSNTSSDRNPGDGRPDDGDTIGWMNRGMDWRDIEDAPRRYAITLLADYPGIEYPLRTDVTLRRLQQFKPRPGEVLNVRVGEEPARSVTIASDGLLTVPKVTIPSKAGTRLVIAR